ncbi:hypothetical protein R1flu_022891 [Riccia fluitans]|uniref:Uncharacterized protein n=1 Tax=Riccia fluitans TaxID=41844 RepID=A0ABD1XQG5_9MARC
MIARSNSEHETIAILSLGSERRRTWSTVKGTNGEWDKVEQKSNKLKSGSSGWWANGGTTNKYRRDQTSGTP